MPAFPFRTLSPLFLHNWRSWRGRAGSRLAVLLVLLPFLLTLSFAAGCAKKDPAAIANGTAVRGKDGPDVLLDGKSRDSLQGASESSTVLHDGEGNVVLIPGKPLTALNPDYADARELKLKIRELAEQLVANMEDCSLRGTVALPISFVNLNNLGQSSALGRLIGEQLFFELNQRGYPVREYRIPGNIRMKERSGEFYISRNMKSLYPKGSVIIVGTYSSTRDAVFINARLVRPSDGRVLRTANLVIERNPTVTELLRKGSSSATISEALFGKSGQAGCEMRIRDYDHATRPPAPQVVTPFDQGQDIH